MLSLRGTACLTIRLKRAELYVLHAAVGSPGNNSQKFLDLVVPSGYIAGLQKEREKVRNTAKAFFRHVKAYSKNRRDAIIDQLLRRQFTFHKMSVAQEAEVGGPPLPPEVPGKPTCLQLYDPGQLRFDLAYLHLMCIL
jgi:hypothetical protein